MTEITFIEDFTHIYKTLLQGGITPENICFAQTELTYIFEQYFYENEEIEIKATEKALADMKVSIDDVFEELADMMNMPIGDDEMECDCDDFQGMAYPTNA